MKKLVERKEEAFTIEEVAERVGVSPRMLRYWEDLELIFPKRTEGKQRRYSSEEIRILSLIRQLTEEFEMSTAEIRVIQKLGCKELALARLKGGQGSEEYTPIWLMILLEGLYAKLVGNRTLELLELQVRKGDRNGKDRKNF